MKRLLLLVLGVLGSVASAEVSLSSEFALINDKIAAVIEAFSNELESSHIDPEELYNKLTGVYENANAAAKKSFEKAINAYLETLEEGNASIHNLLDEFNKQLANVPRANIAAELATFLGKKFSNIGTYMIKYGINSLKSAGDTAFLVADTIGDKLNNFISKGIGSGKKLLPAWLG